MRSIKAKSARTPIYRDAGFVMDDISTMKKAFQDELNHPRDPEVYIYSRYRNPNVVAAEDQIMQLEEANWSLLTQSGLSAIDTALSIFQKKGKLNKWLFFSEIYGGTLSYIQKVLIDRRGIEVYLFNPDLEDYSLTSFESLLANLKPDIVFFELISNPMLITLDGESIIKLSKKHGARVIIDNTFATPYLWRPLTKGADIVIHSVTKYLSGHGNLSAGVLSGNDEELGKLAIEYRKLVGHMLSPDDAYRLSDMLKTFTLRFSKHCQNAFLIANYLHSHPSIERVLYPGIESHKTHRNALKLFKGIGYGAMVTFDLKGESNQIKTQQCELFVGRISKHIPLIPTLGDTETILMPVEPVWGDRYPFPGMVRLSVGIDEPQEVIEVIGNVLKEIY